MLEGLCGQRKGSAQCQLGDAVLPQGSGPGAPRSPGWGSVPWLPGEILVMHAEESFLVVLHTSYKLLHE